MKAELQTDCLFLHVPEFLQDKNSYTLWVCTIAMGVFSMCNELKKEGFNPEILHYGIEKVKNWEFDIANYVKENNIKIIAISLHWHYQAYDSLYVAKKIKEKNPDVFIFLGGYTSSAFAEEIIEKYSFIDAVIKGEGEKPVVELVKNLSVGEKNLNKVPNLIWRQDGKIIKNKDIWFAGEEELNSYNFNGLKFLKDYKDYLHMPIKLSVKNNVKDVVLGAKTSFNACLGRGCPGNCTWCGGGFNAVRVITGRDSITLRNPEVVANEIFSMKEEYNIDTFYFCYDPFPDKQDYILNLFEILGKKLQKQISVTFENFALPSKIFIDSLKRNFNSYSKIIISPEFGNEKFRKFHKGEAYSYGNKEFFEALDYIVQNDIYCTLFFTELPSQDEYNKTLTQLMITKINNLYGKYDKLKVEIIPINDVEPYSPWALNPEKYGITAVLKTIEDYIENGRNLREPI